MKKQRSQAAWETGVVRKKTANVSTRFLQGQHELIEEARHFLPASRCFLPAETALLALSAHIWWLPITAETNV